MHTLEIIWSNLLPCVGIAVIALQGVASCPICWSTFDLCLSDTDRNVLWIKRNKWAPASALLPTLPTMYSETRPL